MGKVSWKPGTMIYPAPAALVTCGNSPEEWTFLTVAWTGTVCSDPPMCYVSVRPERASHAILERCMEFTLNLTTVSMVQATDWAGVRSTRQYNKWKETKLSPLPGEKVASPTIAESPLSIECRIKRIERLGTHDMMLAEVVNLRADERFINSQTGALNLAEAGLLVYAHGGYYSLGELLGTFGFSVRKKPKTT